MKRKNYFLLCCIALMSAAGASGCSLQGPEGPQGEQGMRGEKGDTGEQGPKGDQGIPGIDGKDGSQIQTGTGQPNEESGFVGDLYVDTATGDLYSRGESGWIKTGNIRGSDGQNGKDGVSVVGVAKTNSDGLKDTYTISYSDGSTSEFVVTNGKDGPEGVQGIPGKDGHTPKITIGENGHWFVDGVDTGYQAQGDKGEKGDKGNTGDKGDAGIGIASVVFQSSDGEYDTYAIYLTDGSLGGTFKVKIAKDGEKGRDGHTPVVTINGDGFWTVDGVSTGIRAQGEQGVKGEDGRSIVSVNLVSSEGNIDTYLIRYSDGSSSQFVVTNGKDGKTPYIGENGNWWIDNSDTGVPATGQKGDKGAKGDPGEKGEKGDKGQDGITYVPCIFNNYDGTKLWEFYFEKGTTVIYSGPIPTRPDEMDGLTSVKWTFAGWDKPLENIQKPTIFTAVYESSNVVKCTFNNYDGSLLGYSYCDIGGTATYDGDTPTKPDRDVAEGTIVRSDFSGWDVSLKNVTKETVFTAQFSETTYYLIKFLNYDGSLLKSKYVFSGGLVKYSEANISPTRPCSAVGTTVTSYSFDKWDKTIENATAPATYTATYRQSGTFTGYRVDFLDSKGSQIYYDYFKRGTSAACPANLYPWYYDDQNVSMFVGWDQPLENISAPVQTKAKMMTLSRSQNGEWPQSKVEDSPTLKEIKNRTPGKDGFVHYNGRRYSKVDSTWRLVEPIKWQTISSTASDVFVVSEKILAYRRWSERYVGKRNGVFDNNYKNSEIRSWLNSDFLYSAFGDDSHIKTSMVDNSAMSTKYKNGNNICECENTYDKIFLLSYEEAAAIGRQNLATSEGDESCYWWLRSPANGEQIASCVDEVGDWDSLGLIDSVLGVRPALRFQIK
ncbi:MAG: DUF6273 domain-containing protein [Candidatus Enteromonas sp.]|nr:DUF6273 domain-containing protein [Candidatus Enteromonas sp.]